VEESLCGGFGAIGAVAELGDVQIDFQYPPLGPQGFDQDREIGFEPLAHIAATGPQKKILGDLLADGAGAVHLVAVLIERVRLFDGRNVEAPMLGELLIFGCHDGERQIGRDSIQIDPTVAIDVVGVAARPRRGLRLGHERSEKRIDPTQRRHREDAGRNTHRDQPHDRPYQPADE